MLVIEERGSSRAKQAVVILLANILPVFYSKFSPLAAALSSSKQIWLDINCPVADSEPWLSF